jgi:hypothetical protein
MDIELHTTDELIDELKRRHPDGAVMAFQNPNHEIRSTGNDWRMSFIGNIHVTLKLANVCLWYHQNQIMKSVRNPQGGEYGF